MEFKIGDLVKIKGAANINDKIVIIDICFEDGSVLIEFPDSSNRWWYGIDQIELNYQLIRENKFKRITFIKL